jgi:hypothetical protein
VIPTDTPSSGQSGTAASGQVPLLQRIWPYLVVALLAVVSSSLHVATVTALSPIDETRNLDYMVRIYDEGHLSRLGDRIGQTAMRLEACRGLDYTLTGGDVNPPCSTRRFDSRDFRDDGYNNAVNHPPGYHLITGAVAKLATLLGIADNPLDPARLVGGFWLAAGLMLALYAGELLGIRRVPLVAAATIFAFAPDALNSAAIVNPDGASVFVGGLILVSALLWERGRIPTWALAFAGMTAAAFKMTNFLAVGIIVLWFLTQAYRQRRDPELDRPSSRRYVIACVVLIAVALAVTVVWLGIASARATVDALDLPSNANLYNPYFPRRPLLDVGNLFAFFPAGGQAYRAPLLTTQVVTDLSYISGWLCVAGLLASALRFSVRDRLSTLGGWAMILMIVAGPAFIVSTWLANKVVFQPLPRYALSAFPVVIVLVASLVRGRTATIAFSVYAAVSSAIILGTLIF